MELWFLIIVSLCVSTLIALFFTLAKRLKKTATPLPPGPPTVPILGNIKFHTKPFSEIESYLRTLRVKYGPIITLQIGSRPSIFISTHSLAHQALVQNGAVFADRPPPLATEILSSNNQHNVSSASYGPNWRLFRRNLSVEMLHPSRVKSYSHARKWVLDLLVERLRICSELDESVVLVEHFQYAIFCLLVLMCFGDKLDEYKIRQVEDVQRRLLLGLSKFAILNFRPSLTKILLRKRWEEFLQIIRDKENLLIPLIRARKIAKHENLNKDREPVVCYVDTLLDLELPGDKRKLDEKEIVSFCSEFLDAGTDTTSTALQWIMANLVKYPHIQEKIYEEIGKVVGYYKEVVTEDDLKEMAYLKAVTLEALRRHPPGHFVLPHAVREDTVLNGFLIPKNAAVNFMVAEMGLDPKVWENPMEFRPERFLTEDGRCNDQVDITGRKEIKMMPFSAGRRLCPGYELAMLHLEYFVANLVLKFKWKAVDDEVDLSEKQEFTVVMKNPLRVHISLRSNT